jgi:hypothetical protein
MYHLIYNINDAEKVVVEVTTTLSASLTMMMQIPTQYSNMKICIVML